MTTPTKCRDGLWNGAICLKDSLLYAGDSTDLHTFIGALNRGKKIPLGHASKYKFEDFQEFILPIELML